jgi:3-hexulose-6-phosphate synthase/6-phospho-3-hexuloisomerase
MSSAIRSINRENLTTPLVQISLDLTNVDEALRTATIAVEAGFDWIEVGTPLVLAEGLHAVRALRREFPNHPIIVDLKTMDGGYLEAEMMGDAGANGVVVMARAHDATIEAVIAAGEEFGMLVMGDDLAEDDRVSACVRMEKLGVGMVIHHIGYDHRNRHPELGLSPLTELKNIVGAISVPVQAVGGLTIDQAVGCPEIGAPVVVFGAPLAIDGRTFTPASGDLGAVLAEAASRVHAVKITYPDLPVS